MAVTDYSGLTITQPQTGIQFTKVTDSSSDWASVSNSTYFYDKTDKLVYYKDSLGYILKLFTNYSTLGSWIKVTKAYTDFTDAATSQSITLFSLPAKAVLKGIFIKHTTAFAGTAITAYTLEIGIAGTTDKYLQASDVFIATGSTVFYGAENFDMLDWSSSTNILLTARSVGGNLSAGTAGAVEIHYLYDTLL